MTNKEAIEKLGYIKNQYHVMFNFTDYDEVFDLAIKALEHKQSRGCIECGTNCCLAEIRGEYCPTLAKIMEAENE